MKTVKICDSKFNETNKEMDVDSILSMDEVNVPVVHQVVKSYLSGLRQGTAATKTKGFVRGGGKKPFKQKGTGRARQGSSRSPLMVGGGTAHGPTPRSYEQKVNKKVKILALKSVIKDRLEAGKLIVVDEFTSSGKTRELAQVLSAKGISSTLLVPFESSSLVLRASRNLERSMAVSVDYLNVYQILRHENLIMEKQSFERLLERFN